MQQIVSRIRNATPTVNFKDMEVDHIRHQRWKHSHKRPSDINITRPMSAR